MAETVCLHSRAEVEGFCRRTPALHLYALGDLDDIFWPHTTWYALRDAGGVRELVLVYAGRPWPTVLAYADGPAAGMRHLLGDVLRLLPRRFHAHLTPGLADVLAADYQVTSHGPHRKMRLADAT
ncbi:MAG TPA: hypothetical protein VH092_27170, partial [Urbifossiella sp.]|nr:hypothetical protein [Urbifossiella sp.]